MHAVDRYLLVAEALGATRPTQPRFEFLDRSEDRQAVETMLSRAGVAPHQPWVAMNVSARWETKRWPPQHFAEAADRLSQAHALPVVLIGGPAERAESLAVTAPMRTQAIDLTGHTPVGLLPGLLRRPSHPAKPGLYGKAHVVLSHAVECRPCFRRDCARAVPLECLTAVRPEQVVRAVEQQLERSQKPGSL